MAGQATSEAPVHSTKPVFGPQLSDVGSWASIISLAVSMYVAFKVRNISRDYRQLALLPKWKSQVRAHLKNLVRQLNEKDLPSFKREAVKASVVAMQARTLSSRMVRRSAKKYILAGRNVTTPAMTAFGVDAEQLIMHLEELESHLNSMIEEKKWR